MAKRQTPAARLSEEGEAYLARARRMLGEWRTIMASDGGQEAVRYSQDRHNEITNGIAQLLALGLEHHDRIVALERAATKPRAKKKS